MQIVYAVLTTEPEYRDEVLDRAREIAAASREEPGVTDYRVATDTEEPEINQLEDAEQAR